jgi:ADP-heptose:LPS heptosyltransferase
MAAGQLNRFYAQTRAARKVVVVDLGFLGDTLHLVPALWEIKRHYPQAELHVVSSPLGAELLGLAPCVQCVWSVELHPRRRSWRQQWQLVRALRREAFDVTFGFGGGDRATILLGLTGARWRVAHAAGRQHFWNRWLVPLWAPRQNPDLTVLEQRRQVLAACGFALEKPRFDLRVDPETERWASSLVPAKALHLSISSANPLKEWPIEHHAQLLRRLWEEHPNLAVMATVAPNSRELARQEVLADRVTDGRLHWAPHRLTIAQLAAVLQRCCLHVGPDSGVMHLAMALGVPTVSYFREQGDFQSWLPKGPTHRVVTVPCSCVDHYSGPCERLGQAECLARLQPAQLAELVGKALQRQPE